MDLSYRHKLATYLIRGVRNRTNNPTGEVYYYFTKDGVRYVDGTSNDNILDWRQFEGGVELIMGGNGNDKLYGGKGDDTLFGEEGNDSLWGSMGSDTLVGGNGDDYLDGEQGNDYLLGGAGNDTLYAGKVYGRKLLNMLVGSDFHTRVAPAAF
ncbi:MAG: hypothetical protein GDA56_11225 [Hormoscilla sp. GM7CHS1pb]|nr:hypothetical protein [Hormoscilla sp. GM7CHS1pb]